jgi:hypothetical protein
MTSNVVNPVLWPDDIVYFHIRPALSPSSIQMICCGYYTPDTSERCQ